MTLDAKSYYQYFFGKDIITEIQESNPDLKELEPENEKAKYFKLKPGEKKVKAKIAKKKAKGLKKS